MGGSIQRYTHSSRSSFISINKYQSQYESLGLNEQDILKLYGTFQSIDKKERGWITSQEISHYLHLSSQGSSQLIHKIFTVYNGEEDIMTPGGMMIMRENENNLKERDEIDERDKRNEKKGNQSEKNDNEERNNENLSHISFFSFVISCWSLCTVNQRDYPLYLFELYDIDEIGFLDVKVAQKILEDIYGNNFKDDLQAKRAYELLDGIGNKSIDPFTFQRYGGGNPRTLFHVFTIQSLTRKGIVGEDFWDEQTMKRTQLNPGLHVSIYSLLGRSIQKKNRFRNVNRSGAAYQATSSTACAIGTGTGLHSACEGAKSSVPDVLGLYHPDTLSPVGSHPPELRSHLQSFTSHLSRRDWTQPTLMTNHGFNQSAVWVPEKVDNA